MSRREATKGKARKRNRERDANPGDDVDERSVRSRRDYEAREPRDRDRDRRDYYNYSGYDDRYRGWQDLYRPDYAARYQYSDYDRPYDRYDRYGYSSRRYYDDYYDDYSYGGESDTNCRTCSRRGGGRMYDDTPSYAYRYEEERPGYRYGGGRSSGPGSERVNGPGSGRVNGPGSAHSTRRSRRMSAVPAETDRTRNGNDMDVYAVHGMLGQSGFKKNNKPERVSSEAISEDESTHHREKQRRRNDRRR